MSTGPVTGPPGVARWLATASVGRGQAAVALAGALWAVLLVALHLGGHAPSVSLLPVPRASYYLFQATITVPWLLLMWWSGGTVARAVARRLGGAPGSHFLGGWGVAMAAPLAVFHLLPELVAYGLGGFSMLSTVARFSMPVAALASIALGAVLVTTACGVSRGRGALAALAGVLAQSVIAGPVLR